MSVEAPDVVLREDTLVWPALQALVSCLCQEVTASGLPALCFCGLLPGEQPAGDYVSEAGGMAWVRVVSAYPSTTFPAQDSTAVCGSSLAFEIEMGVAYCTPVMSDLGDPPDVASQYEAVMVQMAAMAAMRRALICCLSTQRDAVLGAYSPIGPEGGIVGGTWQVWLAEAVR